MADQKTPNPASIPNPTTAKNEPDTRYTAPLLERRLREETDTYEFGALLGGVASKDSKDRKDINEMAEPPPPLYNAPVSAPAPPAPARKNTPALLAGAGIGAVVVLGAVFAAVQSGIGQTGGGAAPAQTAPAAVAASAAPVPSPAIATTTAAAATLRPNVGRPDPALTPGRLQAQPRKDAPVSPQTREQVMRAYGVDPADTRYVLCRLVPSSLGGTEDAQNLFPTTAWFADLKVRLDKTLADQVAQKAITADQARQELTKDWIACAHKYEVRNYGLAEKEAARKVETNLRW